MPTNTVGTIDIDEMWESTDWRECQGRLIGHGVYAGYAIVKQRNGKARLTFGQAFRGMFGSLHKALVAVEWPPAKSRDDNGEPNGYYGAALHNGETSLPYALFARQPPNPAL